VNPKLTILRARVAFASLAVGLLALPFSIRICHAGIILYIIVWATEGKWREKLNILKSSVLLQLIAGFFLLDLLGMFYTQNLTDGWFTIEKRIFFFLLPLALATANNKLTKENIHNLLYLFTLSCIAGSFICIASAINLIGNEVAFNNYLSTTNFSTLNPDISAKTWMSLSYVSMSDGIHIHPAFFSLYITFCIVFVFAQLLQSSFSKLVRVLLWCLIIYFSLFIVCLSSRIMILCLLTIVLLFIAREFWYSKNKTHAAIVSCIFVMLIAVIYLNPISRYRSVQEVATTSLRVSENQQYKNSIQIRLSLWWLALKSVNRKNLLVGSGTGDVRDVMKSSGQKYAVSNVLNTYDPHNQYLYTLLSHGLIGLFILVLNLAMPMYLTWSQRDYLYLSFAFLYSAICLTESALELQKGIVFFSLVSPLLLLRRSTFESLKIRMAS
jgi:O-antigen ligase